MKNIEQMRSEIVGPCTPEEKTELRAFLEAIGERFEDIKWWNANADVLDVVRYSPFKEWATDNLPPTITFTDFKSKYMEPKKHPFGMTKESALYIVPILTLSESGKQGQLQLQMSSLQEIQELVLHFGGALILSEKREGLTGYELALQITRGTFIFHAVLEISETQYHLQKAAFSSGMYVAEPGTQLTIIDNQYFQI